MTMSVFRTKLMTSTREVHDRLHAEPRFAALQSANISNADYDGLMAQMGGFYAVFDKHMLSVLGRYPDVARYYSYQPRARLFPKASVVVCELPKLNTIAQIAGAAYVVDGAVLGGQVLGRGLNPHQRHRYWDWCADAGTEVWRSANSLIQAADTGPEARKQGIDTACAVFAAFETAISLCKEQAVA